MTHSTVGTAGAFAFLVLLTAAIPVTTQQGPTVTERTPVLVELFTSEGCSSCPPADRLLATLLKEQPAAGVYIVGLSEHVTYWDHQGWRDPFGALRFTQRQNIYGLHLKLPDVYTPQVVIDGTTELIGSDAAKLKVALAGAAARPKPPLTVAASMANGTVTGSVSGQGLEAGAAEPAEIVWALTEDDLVVEVKRGENANLTLQHSGVVRALVARKLDGRAENRSVVIPLQPDWKREHLRLVAFVQLTKSMRVLSIGWTPLAAS